MPVRAWPAADLAERLGARLVGDARVVLHGLGSLAQAQPGELSHLSSKAYRRLLPATCASAVLLRDADLAACPCTALVVDEPYVAYADASRLFAPERAVASGIDPRATVHPTARVDPSAQVGPGAVIGAGSQVGPGCVVGANTVVGDTCVLAEGVHLHPNVTLYDDVQLGARTVVHSAAVIGADGFGYARDRRGVQRKIAQLGGVRIGADVEIGANTTIDRGAIDHTVIDDGVKIDNQVQIGHNCHIGAHTVICGCVGIVGSTRIGSHCVLGGGVGVGGDGPVELASGVVVSGMSHVSQSVERPGVYSAGTLLAPTREWKRNALRLRELDRLARRLKALEAQVSGLRASED